MADKPRRFRLLLYPDDISHLNAVTYIFEHYDKYIYILHDKDFKEDSEELKKAHWHFIIEFKNGRHLSGVAKELKIEERWLLPCDRFEYALEYLLHFNDLSKYQYDIDECVGTLVGKLKDLINRDNKSECEKVIDILDYIDNTDGYCSYSSLVRRCADVGSFDVLRRSGVLLIKCIDEHNQRYKGFISSDNSSK